MNAQPEKYSQLGEMFQMQGKDPVAIRRRVEALEMLLERSFVVPGINRPIGLDSIVGLIPVIGDFITAALGSYLIWEAKNLGMSKWQTLFYITMPRATRIGLPAYSNEVILMLKASALASTITLLELTGMARTIIARTYLPVEIFFAAGLFYLLISYVLVQAFKRLEQYLRVDACQGR